MKFVLEAVNVLEEKIVQVICYFVYGCENVVVIL